MKTKYIAGGYICIYCKFFVEHENIGTGVKQLVSECLSTTWDAVRMSIGQCVDNILTLILVEAPIKVHIAIMLKNSPWTSLLIFTITWIV